MGFGQKGSESGDIAKPSLQVSILTYKVDRSGVLMPWWTTCNLHSELGRRNHTLLSYVQRDYHLIPKTVTTECLKAGQ